MSEIAVTCVGCGKTFQKAKKEFDRQVRNGRSSFYCDLSCAKQHDRLDEFSDFREMFRNIKKTCLTRNRELNLEIKDLLMLWQKQKGLCAYTGKKMILSRGKHIPTSASLDRIDSSKGYIKGNVEFVCLFINFGKNGFTKDQVKDFLGV